MPEFDLCLSCTIPNASMVGYKNKLSRCNIMPWITSDLHEPFTKCLCKDHLIIVGLNKAAADMVTSSAYTLSLGKVDLTDNFD